MWFLQVLQSKVLMVTVPWPLKMLQALSACSFPPLSFFCVFICIPGGSSPACRCRVIPLRPRTCRARYPPHCGGGEDPGNAFHVAFDSCLRRSGAWVFEHNLFKNKQVCTLVLVDELQAGLADGDIYLSVYLKEVWFKSFSFRFIYLCAGCMCVCVRVCAYVRVC